jgi:ankyrin repeat protein
MMSAIFVSVLLGVPGQGDRPETVDPFQAAVIAASHHFAADGELDHLRAVLDKYPKLVNATQVFRQPHKPLRTDGFTALHHAAERGRSEVVSYLLEKGADVNSADGLCWTPLHLAAEQGHLPVVKQLVRAGAKVDAKTVAIPEQVPPGGADRDPGDPPQKWPAIPSRTPLELAQEAKHDKVVEFLKAIK